MPDLMKVASLNDLPPGRMITVEVNDKAIVLANVEGKLFAFGGECTHRGGPLGEGELEGDIVTCPWHNGQFNVKTGEVAGPPPVEPVPTYQVQVEGDDIKVAAS